MKPINAFYNIFNNDMDNFNLRENTSNNPYFKLLSRIYKENYVNMINDLNYGDHDSMGKYMLNDNLSSLVFSCSGFILMTLTKTTNPIDWYYALPWRLNDHFINNSFKLIKYNVLNLTQKYITLYHDSAFNLSYKEKDTIISYIKKIYHSNNYDHNLKNFLLNTPSINDFFSFLTKLFNNHKINKKIINLINNNNNNNKSLLIFLSENKFIFNENKNYQRKNPIKADNILEFIYKT